MSLARVLAASEENPDHKNLSCASQPPSDLHASDSAALCEGLRGPYLLPGHRETLGNAAEVLWNQARDLITFFKGTILHDREVWNGSHADIFGNARSHSRNKSQNSLHRAFLIFFIAPDAHKYFRKRAVG